MKKQKLSPALKEKKIRSLTKRLETAERLYDKAINDAVKYQKRITILGNHLNKLL